MASLQICTNLGLPSSQNIVHLLNIAREKVTKPQEFKDGSPIHLAHAAATRRSRASQTLGKKITAIKNRQLLHRNFWKISVSLAKAQLLIFLNHKANSGKVQRSVIWTSSAKNYKFSKLLHKSVYLDLFVHTAFSFHNSIVLFHDKNGFRQDCALASLQKHFSLYLETGNKSASTITAISGFSIYRDVVMNHRPLLLWPFAVPYHQASLCAQRDTLCWVCCQAAQSGQRHESN